MREGSNVLGWKIVAQDSNGGITYRPEGEEPISHQFTRKPKPRRRPNRINWQRVVDKFVVAMDSDRRSSLSEDLVLKPSTLERFHIGWCEAKDAYTIPMRNGDCRIIGVRLRDLNGKHYAIRGSLAGVFCYDDFWEKYDECPVLICEGASDAMALSELGYWTIGRPSCSGGCQHIAKLVAGFAAVVVSDRDTPGRRGADDLASELAKVCPSVRVIEPPKAKDAREWIASGATGSVIDLVINQATEWVDAKSKAN